MTGRLVWIEDDEMGLLDDSLAGLVRNRWDAAPADPEKAVGTVLHHGHPDPPCPACEDTIAVLRALGMPDS